MEKFQNHLKKHKIIIIASIVGIIFLTGGLIFSYNISTARHSLSQVENIINTAESNK